jgi:phosphonate transport system ATP-binding protein
VIYSVDSVSKVYAQGRTNVRALHGISLQVTEGQHIALLGRSGAGKSTLFRLLNATIRPTSGAVSFEGQDLSVLTGTQIRTVRRRIGTIYQQHNLVPALTVLQNTLCGGLGRWSFAHTLKGMFRPEKQDLDKALSAIESVGLADKRHARADELSGGQQQRVAIARTLMQDPEVILADEPIASLDPTLAGEIIDLLTRIASENKRTLIVSMHKAELAIQRLSRAVALRDGKIEFDLASSDVNEKRLNELYSSRGTVALKSKMQAGFRNEFNCLS